MLFKSIKVSSSNILSIGYDRHSELLQVTFKSVKACQKLESQDTEVQA